MAYSIQFAIKSSFNGNTLSTLPSQQASPIVADRFGLMGLLNVIRMTDQDLNTLALGFDLTTLGLNLNATEYVVFCII
jgi:CCR4-NOT transcription complex subunit 2